MESRKPTPGFYHKQTPVTTPIVFEDDPTVSFNETTPRDPNPNLLLYQQIIRVFDELDPSERLMLAALAEAFVLLSPDEKRLITAAAEKLSGLTAL